MVILYIIAVFSLYPLVSNAEEINVKSGDDITLQCQSPGREAITVLEWIRPDLKTDDYVFFFRDDRSYENYQLPSFRGRVQLRDPEMKNGDVSVILKNVTINDTGTYQCHVFERSRKLKNTTINLKVEDSAGDIRTEADKDGGDKNGGNKDGSMGGHLGLVVGLSVTAVIVAVGLVIFMIYKRFTNPSHPPAEEAGDQQM